MIERVKKVMEMEQLTSSQFADEINLQRSSLSHVLSGRNKPSLDFVMKIKIRFSEINLDWLVFGTGQMYIHQQKHEVDIDTNLQKAKINLDIQKEIEFDKKSNEVLAESPREIEKLEIDINPTVSKKVISRSNRVMIFFSDGTFEEYINKN